MNKLIEKIQRDRVVHILENLFIVLLIFSLIWNQGTIGTVLDGATTILLLIILGRYLYLILHKKELPPLTRPGKKRTFFNLLGSVVFLILFAVFVRPDNPVIQWILNGVIVAAVLLFVIGLFRLKDRSGKEG